MTANHRLAEIELAGGGCDAELAYAQGAYERDATNPVTWQLLGDAQLALGRVDEAYRFRSRVDGTEGKLGEEAWLRNEKKRDTSRAAWANQLPAKVRAIHEWRDPGVR